MMPWATDNRPGSAPARGMPYTEPPMRARRGNLCPAVAPSSHQLAQGAALLFLPGDLPGKDVAVDVRVDGGEDHALEFVRRQYFHLPLHRAAGIEASSAPDSRTRASIRYLPDNAHQASAPNARIPALLELRQSSPPAPRSYSCQGAGHRWLAGAGWPGARTGGRPAGARRCVGDAR